MATCADCIHFIELDNPANPEQGQCRLNPPVPCVSRSKPEASSSSPVAGERSGRTIYECQWSFPVTPKSWCCSRHELAKGRMQ